MTQAKTLTCRIDAASQRALPPPQTLSRRVRSPQPATFPATLLPRGRLKQSLAIRGSKIRPITTVRSTNDRGSIIFHERQINFQPRPESPYFARIPPETHSPHSEKAASVEESRPAARVRTSRSERAVTGSSPDTCTPETHSGHTRPVPN